MTMTSNKDIYQNAWKLDYNVQIMYLRIDAYFNKSTNVANYISHLEMRHAPCEDVRESLFVVRFGIKVASVIAHLSNIVDIMKQAYPTYCARALGYNEKEKEKERGKDEKEKEKDEMRKETEAGKNEKEKEVPEYQFGKIIREIQEIGSKHVGDKEKYDECERIYGMIDNLVNSRKT
jgi:hypothetical protein